MAKHRLLPIAIGLAAALGAAGALACGASAAPAPPAPSSPTLTTPPSATAPLLAVSHPGARGPLCAACPFASRGTRACVAETAPNLPGADNPAWCTYGTCPNCAFLIRQDGAIDMVQTWFDKDAMERAIRALLAR